MTSWTITVPEIHCGHCKTSIEEAVSALDGVQSVQVDVEPRSVDVTFDESTVSRDAITSAIQAVGYEVPYQT